MRFIDKVKSKKDNNMDNAAVTVAFFGDSVTQGCFEIYLDGKQNIQTIFDQKCGYHNYFKNIFSYLWPSVPINIVNAGISGDSAVHAKERVIRDVVSHQPDLTIVCFGLNDSMQGVKGLSAYVDALASIFDELQNGGSEIVFMTPNTMNMCMSPFLSFELEKAIAKEAMQIQNDGILGDYLNAAKKLCDEKNIKFCDCYSKWCRLAELGVDTTELLANKINHPKREMNWIFAVSLFETIFDI